MKTSVMCAVLIATAYSLCFSQTQPPRLAFDRLFPKEIQTEAGLTRLTAREREVLRAHVEKLLTVVLAAAVGASSGGEPYVGIGSGHWIKKNVDSGAFILLEDGSLWKIDPLDKVDAMLWLPISDVTVIKSGDGTPGYDYLLINTDDGEKAHGMLMGPK
jgi:hypothetical protein